MAFFAALPLCIACGNVAHAAPTDTGFAAMLMKDGIEAYSEAGARGDQKTADALLDEDVLFAGGDGSVDHDEKRDKDDAIAATLKAQTQVMRQARLTGDKAVLQRFISPDLIAIDESGKIVEGAFPPTAELPLPGAPLQSKLGNWIVHHDGNSGVVAYVDERSMRYGGQTLRFRSLLVDTWVMREGRWKLFATHATPLFDDAPTAALPAGALDAYTGTYRIGAGAKAAITRDGNTLLSSVNGGKQARYAPEMPDVFYALGSAPGSARPHLYFRRDAAGQISGYASSSGLVLEREAVPKDSAPAPGQGVDSSVLPAAKLVVHRLGDVAVASFIHERVTHYYGQTLHAQYRSTETWVKRGESWKMLSLQSRALENEMPSHKIDAREAQAYAGDYAAGSGVSATIKFDGGALSLVAAKAAVALGEVARDDFAIPGSPGTNFLFQRNAAGRVMGYVARREGQDLLFVRIGA